MNGPPGEKLTRFIRYNSHFRTGTNTVRFEAFLPRNDQTAVSAFRISGLSDTEVWKIGWDHVEQGGETIKARADFFVCDVCKSGLKVIMDGEGHERHVSLQTFPPIQSSADRRIRQEFARKLANASKLQIPPARM